MIAINLTKNGVAHGSTFHYISHKQLKFFFVSSETGQVRLWAAMRTQTVAKTVVGALQCALGGPSTS